MHDYRLIINADDFGYNSDINRAIVTSFSKGLCSSSTIMANMPGFEEACQLCHDNGLTDCVGIHLVLTKGMPLTDGIKKCSRFCGSEGLFQRKGHFFKLTNEEKVAVPGEIAAQIDRCRKYGIPLSHLDSHHHIHNEWGIAVVLLPLAKDKKVRYIRLARHLDPDSIWFKNLYRRLLNYRIRANHAAATRFFGTVEDFVRFEKKMKNNRHSFEVMVHPAFNEKQVLIDSISKEPLEKYVSVIDGYKNAVSYGRIAENRFQTDTAVR